MSENSMPASRARIAAALFALYIIWGSTYLAMRFAIESLPPLGMGGVRFLFAGSLLFVFLRVRGARLPTLSELGAAFPIGLLLLTCGNGGVAFAQQRVSSSVAAMVIASVPLWAALFGGLLGTWPRPVEWLGLLLGTVGVVVLNSQGDLRAEPRSAAFLLGAAAAWALGSVWSRRLPSAPGLMASALQMMWGGMGLLTLSRLTGEQVPQAVATRSLFAVAYLTVFGSLVAFSAYSFLLRAVRPTVATSYAFVNPVVAVCLGVLLAGEHVTQTAFFAMSLILAGVALATLTRSPETPVLEPAKGAPRAG